MPDSDKLAYKLILCPHAGPLSPGNIADPGPSSIQKFINPSKDELPDDFSMPIWDHLEELRERVLVGGLAAAVAILTCFCFSKDLVVFLEAPVVTQVRSTRLCDLSWRPVCSVIDFFTKISRLICLCIELGLLLNSSACGTAHYQLERVLRVQGVKFLQLSPGEFFFTTLKVSGYAGLLVATPTMLYQVVAYVVPGLTTGERKILAPVIFGSSILFYVGLLFSYEILTPAALSFFVSYACLLYTSPSPRD